MVLTSIEGTHMTTLGIDMSNPDPTCSDETKLPILTKYFNDLADIHVQLSGITYPLIGSFTPGYEFNITMSLSADITSINSCIALLNRFWIAIERCKKFET